VGWICADPELFAAAKAMLDVKHPDSLPRLDENVYTGRIGTADIAICYMPMPLHSSKVAIAARTIMESAMRIESIVVSGAISVNSDINPGDLIINPLKDTNTNHSDTMPVRNSSLSRQAVMLQREVGRDGRWLSSNFSPTALGSSESLTHTQLQPSGVHECPSLHYWNLGQDRQNRQSSPAEDTVASKSARRIMDIAEGFQT
jgi:hypothetical protein